jgi:hypothetical protein
MPWQADDVDEQAFGKSMLANDALSDGPTLFGQSDVPTGAVHIPFGAKPVEHLRD